MRKKRRICSSASKYPFSRSIRISERKKKERKRKREYAALASKYPLSRPIRISGRKKERKRKM